MAQKRPTELQQSELDDLAAELTRRSYAKAFAGTTAAVYGKRRSVHLGHAARQVGRQVSHQPAQVVVLESGSRDHQ